MQHLEVSCAVRGFFKSSGFKGLMRPGHKADNSPASAAKVRNVWSDTTIPPYAFICLPGARLNQGTGTALTFTFLNFKTDEWHVRRSFFFLDTNCVVQQFRPVTKGCFWDVNRVCLKAFRICLTSNNRVVFTAYSEKYASKIHTSLQQSLLWPYQYRTKLHPQHLPVFGNDKSTVVIKYVDYPESKVRWALKKKPEYSKTCLKRNAIVPVFFFPFSQISVLQRVVF